MSSLEPAFRCKGDNRAIYDLVTHIEELLTLQTKYFNNIFHFANAIMKNRRRIKGEKKLQYNLTLWKKYDAFDILNDISEDVTLVQFMDSLGNVNHAISILGHWIFYSNYEKALFFTQ